MTRGKLIVLEGTDGSGKGTQATLLINALKNQHIPVEMLDFPRYGQSFFGDLAGRMLKGEFGGVEAVPSELAVLPFACDRWLIKERLLAWLEEGKTVVSNRYTASSAVYQASKLPEEKQQAFIDWVYMLEQEAIGLPHEDLVLFCHVPPEIAQSLVSKKTSRNYLGGQEKDIYEADFEIQKAVDRLYRSLADKYSHWKTIECVNHDALESPEAIHKRILDVLRANAVYVDSK
jgi:dTMP kinase